MTILAPLPVQSFKDSNGNPLAGGLLYTYVAGTSTPQATFIDVTGASPNTNPVVLNSRGEAAIWLANNQSYKFILYDAASNLIWSVDQISSSNSGGAPVPLASTATTDIGVQVSQAVEISGTTAITSFGTNYNGPRFLRFTGILVLTQSAALNLPSGVSITTAVGDTAIAYPNQAGNGWNLISYTKADGTAIAAQTPPLVRQTVLSGPVDTNGQSAFGGATGSTVVTATGTLVMTSANGVSNRTGTKLTPSWTGLSTNGAMYLYADVNASGTITEGAGTLQPIYQQGGTPSIVAGQFTFNTGEMVGYVGSGAAAVASNRVYVGEVSVSGAVVASINWYALNGRYTSPQFAIPAAGAVQTLNHFLGCIPQRAGSKLICVTAEAGFIAGEAAPDYVVTASGVSSKAGSRLSRIFMAWGYPTGTSPAIAVISYSTGAYASITTANWKIQFDDISRGW